MDNISFSLLILYFTIYSFAGWLCETIWCSVGSKKPINRGFLSGPWCPIYGFGALLILSITEPLPKNIIIIFLVSMISTSLWEYFTGWLMEALFQTKWWDYSNRPFNLKGRICLRNSLIFGLMGLLVTLFIHPLTTQFVNLLSPETQRVVASLIVSILFIDLVKTLSSVSNLKERLESLKTLFQELEEYQKEYGWYDRGDLSGSLEKLRIICEQDNESNEATIILERINKFSQLKNDNSRILSAFPKMRPKELSLELETLRHEIQTKISKQKEKNYKRKLQLKEMYSNVTAINMIWIFLIASVLGYVVETIYCVLKLGYLESRQGMIYGPFSQVYGFGAIILVLILTPILKKGNVVLFIGSAIIGGLFEVLCSIFQETFFGSVSWEYSDAPFSFFGGRTSLIYMLFWGILGTLYMQKIYPRIIELIDRLAKRPKHFFSTVIVILLCSDIILSAMAVGRWSERFVNETPHNSIERWLDKHYPDEMLEEIYPNMQFLNISD